MARDLYRWSPTDAWFQINQLLVLWEFLCWQGTGRYKPVTLYKHYRQWAAAKFGSDTHTYTTIGIFGWHTRILGCRRYPGAIEIPTELNTAGFLACVRSYYEFKSTAAWNNPGGPMQTQHRRQFPLAELHKNLEVSDAIGHYLQGLHEGTRGSGQDHGTGSAHEVWKKGLRGRAGDTDV